MALREYLVGEIVQDCGDGLLTRREALRRLGLLGVGVATAGTLLAACADDDDDAGSASTSGSASGSASGAEVEATEGTELITIQGPAGARQAAFATPEDPKGAI